MKRLKSIKFKIIIPVVATIAVSVLILLFIIFTIFMNSTESISKKYADSTAIKIATEIKGDLEGLLSQSELFASLITSEIKKNNFDHNSVVDNLKTLLETNKDLIGAGVLLEKDFASNPKYGFPEGKSPYIYKIKPQETIQYMGYEEYATADFYSTPKSINASYVTESYYYELANEKVLMITFCSPIYDENGKFIGVIACDINDINFFDKIMKDVRVFDTGYVFLLSPGQMTAYHPFSQSGIGTFIYDDWVGYDEDIAAVNTAQNTMQATYTIAKSMSSGATMIYSYHPFNIGNSKKPWIISASIDLGEMNRESNRAILLCTILGVLILVVLIFLIYLIINKLTSPIKELVGISKKISRGDINIYLTSNEQDEIGQLMRAFGTVVDGIKDQASALAKMSEGDFSIAVQERSELDVISKSMNKMIATQRAYIENITTILSKVAKGDFTAKIETDYVGDFKPIQKSINEMIYKVNTYIGETDRVLGLLSKGSLSERIDMEFVGSFDRLKKSINLMIETQSYYVSTISEVMSRIQKGDLSAGIDIEFLGDFKPIQRSVNSTVNELKIYIQEIKNVLSAVSKGDLTQNFKIKFEGDFKELEVSIVDIMKSLQLILTEINHSADEVALGASQMAEGMSLASRLSVEQMTAISRLTLSSNQIRNNANSNFENTEHALKINLTALDDVNAGNEKMSTMIGAMNDISETSKQIYNIIKTINEIALQTNLLALNAAVEAARAGQAGKGFTVVAEEVRSLSNRSAEAAKEITNLIGASLEAVKKGEGIAKETANTLNDIVLSTTKANDIMQNITDSTKEQVVSTNSINNDLAQIEDKVQANSSSIEETAAASEELASQAHTLKEMVSKFKLQ